MIFGGNQLSRIIITTNERNFYVNVATDSKILLLEIFFTAKCIRIKYLRTFILVID